MNMRNKRVSISKARKDLARVIDAVRKSDQRYTITQKGKDRAVILSLGDLESLEIMADSKIIDSIGRGIRDVKNDRNSYSCDIYI